MYFICVTGTKSELDKIPNNKLFQRLLPYRACVVRFT